VAAIELLEHLTELSKGTEREQFFVALRQDVEEDQGVLRQLLRSLGTKESRVRKAAAWLAEKLGEAKFQLDDPGSGQLLLLQALEALGLGVQGKLALWRALGAVAERMPRLSQLDLAGLERRARDQYARVEAERLRVARDTLG
jgi:hypothetical protein